MCRTVISVCGSALMTITNLAAVVNDRLTAEALEELKLMQAMTHDTSSTLQLSRLGIHNYFVQFEYYILSYDFVLKNIMMYMFC